MSDVDFAVSVSSLGSVLDANVGNCAELVSCARDIPVVDGVCDRVLSCRFCYREMSMTFCFHSNLHIGHTRESLGGVVVVVGNRDELSVRELVVDVRSVGVETPWRRFASSADAEPRSFIGRRKWDAPAFIGDGMSAEADEIPTFPQIGLQSFDFGLSLLRTAGRDRFPGHPRASWPALWDTSCFEMGLTRILGLDWKHTRSFGRIATVGTALTLCTPAFLALTVAILEIFLR